MLAWRHGGFSAHNEVSVAAEDAEGRKKLAGYMLRAPMSLQKMTYDAVTGTVIYRPKMHAGLKRNLKRLSRSGGWNRLPGVTDNPLKTRSDRGFLLGRRKPA